MLSSLIPLLYIQLSPSRLAVRNARTGASWDEVPEVAILDQPRPTILAAGRQAREAAASTGARVANPFAHPRSVVSDFVLAEQLLRHCVQHVLRQGRAAWLSPSPRIVLHPPSNPAGGYTQVELRALRELALGSGANKATLWHGPPLSDGDLLSGRYPPTGQVLE